jgi:HEAT repeat protein
MHPRLKKSAEHKTIRARYRLVWLIVLFLPVSLLLLGALRTPDAEYPLLWLGALVQGLGCFLLLISRWRSQPAGTPVIMLYVIALSWMLLGSAGMEDWYFHLAQAVLLVVPLCFFSVQCLRESGALAMRQARLLAGRLSRRRDWPSDPQACRALPEVKALREALQVDAGPALALLAHSRMEVRVAALAALEFRQDWLPGQPELILQVLRQCPEPEVKIGCIYALANVDDRPIIEAIAEFMYDPTAAVRKAAAEALLWNTEERWAWIRVPVRTALAHPNSSTDGSLLASNGPPLPPEAVADLTGCAAEKGQIALRAALTLGVHYQLALTNATDPLLPQKLRNQLADVHAPSILRLELGRVLHQQQELDDTVLHRLIDPSTPAPLRLIAVEALLSKSDSGEAVAALRELARLPNREIALATADVVQRRLGITLGLARNQPLPPVHSRQAAEVARRLLHWASQTDGLLLGEPAVSEPEIADLRSVSEL